MLKRETPVCGPGLLQTETSLHIIDSGEGKKKLGFGLTNRRGYTFLASSDRLETSKECYLEDLNGYHRNLSLPVGFRHCHHGNHGQ